MSFGKVLAVATLCLAGWLKPLSLCGQSYEVWNMNWKHLGPFRNPVQTVDPGQLTPMGLGWIESVAVFDNDERYIYAGSNTGGIYCTADGGAHWKNISPPGRVSGVRDIVIDYEDQEKLWIATGTGPPVTEQSFGSGILFSENGGKTWQETGLSFGGSGGSEQMWQLERSLSDPDVFYAASDTRIYRSTDGCHTFEQVYVGESGSLFRHLLIHPLNPDLVVSSGLKTLISTDGGQTWNDVTSRLSYNFRNDRGEDPERIAIGIHPAYPNGLFALYRSGYRNYLDESSDWGSSWINVNVNRDLTRVDRNHAEVVALSGDVVIAGSVRLYKLNVATGSVDVLTQPVYGAPNFAHDDIRAIQITTSGNIYIGTDGGVSMSPDSGRTWKDISGYGLSVTQIYGLDVSPFNPDFIAIGCQDLGNMYYYKKQWYHMSRIYGDGGNVHFMADGSLVIMQNGRMLSTQDTGSTWKSLGQPFLANRFQYPVHFLHTDSGTVITAADHYIWQLNIHGKWTKLTGDAQRANAKKSAMDVNPSDPRSIIFANWEPTWGSGDLLKNRLYRSMYKGDSLYWEDITPRLAILDWAGISAIVTHPDHPERVWVSLYRDDGRDNVKAYKVYYSDNRGDSWVNYSEGFANVGTWCMLYVPGSDGGILVGTDIGVFYRETGMKTWVHLGGAMPEIMVKDMAIDEKSRLLRVGTHGNGVWETRLPRHYFR